MKKYTGILTNTFLDINNMKLSEKLLKDIFEQQQIVPVTINFGGTAIGRTEKIHVADGELICEFSLFKDIPLINKLYVVPGLDNVKYHYEGKVRVIDEGDLTEVFISTLPSNPHLRPIKLIEGEK